MTPTPSDAHSFERLFHEPNRLAILSALCAEEQPLTFTMLRDACNLTDGNLNRHLAVLEEAGVVVLDKQFVDRKPRTAVRVTAEGLARFRRYLDTLAELLAATRAALPARAPRKREADSGKPVSLAHAKA
jgi:DNA-binding transcriptional ArsR family regulator